MFKKKHDLIISLYSYLFFLSVDTFCVWHLLKINWFKFWSKHIQFKMSKVTEGTCMIFDLKIYIWKGPAVSSSNPWEIFPQLQIFLLLSSESPVLLYNKLLKTCHFLSSITHIINNLIHTYPNFSKTTPHIYTLLTSFLGYFISYLADPGEAMGYSTNTFVID